ncbi:MAG TPA: alpha/beta hydrolase [Tepidisphaeraceae bacterium]|jgi:alpha-beta hydrolase superfamily lysophospholipase|nr:alpha/beta hydrolase [Tepidisphaeraceae bacterium]
MNAADCTESQVDIPVAALRLHCRIIRPTSTPVARLLIVHGYGEHAGRYLRFMRFMAGHGIVCEAIDLRGHGRSSGRRGFVRQWDEYLDDAKAFLQWSRDQAQPGENLPVFLLGHSHGGLISAAAGERGILREAKIAGCILASPYLATCVPPPAAKRIFAHAADKVVPWLCVKSNLRPEWLTSDPAMLEEDKADVLMNHSATPRWFLTMRLAQARVVEEAPRFTLPFLCLTGDADRIADPAIAADFYERSGSADKSLYTYPARLHELLREVDHQTVSRDILQWIKARSRT